MSIPIDAIQLAVFRNAFAAVAEEMGLTLKRAAFSPNIRERLDFSCAIFDARAQMVAQAAHIPVHLGSMPASVAAAIGAFAGTFAPGDVIIVNDPYRGGTHLPDVTMVTPVFHGGELAFFAASRAHHADIGGMSPGSLPLSTELYQEGLIIPPTKLYAAGTRNDGVWGLLLANTRSPDERAGDFEAQLAAQRAGERRLAALIGKYGLDLLTAGVAALFDYAQRLTEAAIDAIPDGEYTFEDALESDGQAEYRLPIRATVRVTGRRLHIDFAGSAPQAAGNLNTVEAIVRSACWYCIRLLATDDVPVNQGCFTPVTVSVPSGSLLNARFPAAVAVGNTETSQRIVDAVLGALALALPGRIPAASQGSMNNVILSGPNRTGGVFVYYETIGGGHGGGPSGAGISGRHSHMTNTRNTPVEALEYAYPVQVTAYALRDGSGGGGAQPGGMGIRRAYRMTVPTRYTLNTERRIYAPYGLAGGTPGGVGRNTLIRQGERIALGGKVTGVALPGDVLEIETPGGGGWGDAG